MLHYKEKAILESSLATSNRKNYQRDITTHKDEDASQEHLQAWLVWIRETPAYTDASASSWSISKQADIYITGCSSTQRQCLN